MIGIPNHASPITKMVYVNIRKKHSKKLALLRTCRTMNSRKLLILFMSSLTDDFNYAEQIQLAKEAREGLLARIITLHQEILVSNASLRSHILANIYKLPDEVREHI